MEFSAEGDDKATEAIESWLALSLENTGETLSFNGDGFSFFTVSTYADAGKVSAAKLKMLKALSAGASFSNLVLKSEPKVKEADQKFGEYTLHSALIEVDYEASVKNTMDETQRDLAIEAMKKLVPQKQTLWFGSDGKNMVNVNGKRMPQKGYHVGDAIGAFKLLGFNGTHIQFDWDGEAVTRTLEELRDRSGPVIEMTPVTQQSPSAPVTTASSCRFSGSGMILGSGGSGWKNNPPI